MTNSLEILRQNDQGKIIVLVLISLQKILAGVPLNPLEVWPVTTVKPHKNQEKNTITSKTHPTNASKPTNNTLNSFN